jgi:hypothetical protein
VTVVGTFKTRNQTTKKLIVSAKAATVIALRKSSASPPTTRHAAETSCSTCGAGSHFGTGWNRAERVPADRHIAPIAATDTP